MPKPSFFSVKDIFQDRRKLIIFLVCVLLASLSWVLISLGKTYSTTLIVPVKYINFPQNKTLLNEVPSQLAVNIEGKGFDLMQYDGRLTEDTLVVNLDNLQMSVLGDYQRGYLDQSIISKNLQDRLNGVLAINRVLTDSINFLFDLKVSRVLPVKPKVSFTVAKGFVLLDSIESIPPEIEVYGALTIVDTMQHVPTLPIDLGEISSTQKLRMAVASTGFLARNESQTDSVSVEISIDRLTERTFLITPEKRNVPDSIDLLLFPNGVEITVQIPLSRFDAISDEDFDVYVDYDDLEDDFMVLPVGLESWPTIAQNVTIKPNKVEVVRTKKE
ncbi:MAG: hypothetical protein WEC59_02375 [Salibacteraceae bacterium]